MTRREEPPGGGTSQSESADGCGVNRKRRWANPEKSGGAKFLGCGADLTAGLGARYASRTAIGKIVGNPMTQRLDLPHGRRKLRGISLDRGKSVGW